VVLQAPVGLVVAHARLADIEAEVLHVAEQMALGVLRAEAAEPRAHAEVGDRLLFARHALHGPSAQQHEAAALEQLGKDLLEHSAQPRQRERRRRVLRRGHATRALHGGAAFHDTAVWVRRRA